MFEFVLMMFWSLAFGFDVDACIDGVYRFDIGLILNFVFIAFLKLVLVSMLGLVLLLILLLY